jgi:hypothetical protein
MFPRKPKRKRLEKGMGIARGKAPKKVTRLRKEVVPPSTVNSARNTVVQKNTHNTVDCKRYEKDGTQKKAFQPKKGTPNKTADRKSYKTLKRELKETKSALKNVKKTSHKSKKRNRDDSSDDTNCS